MKGTSMHSTCCSLVALKMTEIPSADSFANPWKKGFLLKLTNRGWFFSGCWKKRFCVLDGSKFYYYEKEDSRGNESTTGVINLDYFDLCEEVASKEKKIQHVFVIGTSVRGFFDNRHQFATETEAELQEWIRAVNTVISDARNSRTRAGRKKESENGKLSPDFKVQKISEKMDEIPVKDDSDDVRLIPTTKDRVRGPQGRRPPQRKSMMSHGTKMFESDQKQRSFSLSSPEDVNEEDEIMEDNLLKSASDSKWLSLSMEDVDRKQLINAEAKDIDDQRSSSSFDIPLRQEVSHETTTHKSSFKTKIGRLGVQHAALAQELQMKLKSGLELGNKRIQLHEPEKDADSESCEIKENLEQNLHGLSDKVNSVNIKLDSLEKVVEELTTRITETSEDPQEMQDIVNRAKAVMTEVERTTNDCKQSLEETKKIQEEYKNFVQKCKEQKLDNMCQDNTNHD